MRAIHIAWFCCCALTAPGFIACGGTVSTSPGSAGSDSGGASGSAASAGSAGSGAAGSCVYDGKTYPDGARFPDTDGCNSCFCESGSVGCTLVDCAVHCHFGGKIYRPGDTFKNDCNSCACESDGSISCTEIACADQCTELQQQYVTALKQAKACDPGQRGQLCTGMASAAIVCGCPTPVNADNTEAIAVLTDIAERSSPGCRAECPTCIAQTSVPTCSAAGSCESIPIQEGSAACKVDGILYPSGSSFRWNCNTCACDNGRFGFCSSMKCPEDTTCPSGTDVAWQCVACGPSGGCLIGEYSCLPTCDDAHPCAVGACSDDGHCTQSCR